MAFENRSTQDLIQIAAAGGGFKLAAGIRPTQDLIQIAAAASRNKNRIVLTGVSLRSTQELIQIATAGQGAISFEE